MASIEHVNQTQPERLDDLRQQMQVWKRPVLKASLAVALLLLLIVATSKSAWVLLGAGRDFIPEGYYHLWGFVLLVGTVIGQVVGWAAASAAVFYLMTGVGFPATRESARIAMSVVYIGLAVVPVSVYHLLYGGGLLGMPRAGVKEWLAANDPGAYWLVIYAHPVIELALIPLAIGVLTIFWKHDVRLERDPKLQTTLALCLLGTSMAVALSLAIHSILVHIRL